MSFINNKPVRTIGIISLIMIFFDVRTFGFSLILYQIPFFIFSLYSLNHCEKILKKRVKETIK